MAASAIVEGKAGPPGQPLAWGDGNMSVLIVVVTEKTVAGTQRN